MMGRDEDATPIPNRRLPASSEPHHPATTGSAATAADRGGAIRHFIMP
jgi:hypothetical protein